MPFEYKSELHLWDFVLRAIQRALFYAHVQRDGNMSANELRNRIVNGMQEFAILNPRRGVMSSTATYTGNITVGANHAGYDGNGRCGFCG